MDFEVGAILTGKVTGIVKYGAFVTVAPGKSGLVHISEIAGAYVNDVREYLTEGQEVTVKIVGVDQTGRINLSIKAATAPAAPVRERFAPPRDRQPQMRDRPAPVRERFAPVREGSEYSQSESPESAHKAAFEDKLKRFMQDSDSKMSDLRHSSDRRSPRRRGK